MYEGPRWYAVYTRSRHEKLVAEKLLERKVESFLPLIDSVRKWKDRRKVIQLPLFPGYLFARVIWKDHLQVLKTRGVVRIIGDGNGPMPVPDDQIEAIQRLVFCEVKANPYPYLSVGRRVEVRRGPLKGIQGILIRKKSLFRLVLSVDLIQKSVALEVNAEDIVPLGS